MSDIPYCIFHPQEIPGRTPPVTWFMRRNPGSMSLMVIRDNKYKMVPWRGFSSNSDKARYLEALNEAVRLANDRTIPWTSRSYISPMEGGY